MNEKIRKIQRKIRRELKQQSPFDLISIQDDINRLQEKMYTTKQKKPEFASMDSMRIQQLIQSAVSLENKPEQQIHLISVDAQLPSYLPGGDALDKKPF